MTKKKVQLGSFCIYNPNTRIIKRADGQEEQLSHLPAELLELLYSNKHLNFSNQELQKLIWLNKTVENNTIMRTISTVRNALGHSREFKFIETRRNKGYQFVADVKELSTLNLKLIKLSGLISIMLFVLALMYYSLLPQKINIPQTLTTLIGQELDGAVSNGNFVISHKSFNDEFWNLRIKKLNKERYFRLTNGAFNDRRATFSPDGKRLAFNRLTGNQCQIIIADFNELAMSLENIKVVHRCPDELRSVSIAWKDNEHLFLSIMNTSKKSYQIFQLNLLTSQLHPLTEPSDNSRGDFFVTYSPESNRMVYLRYLVGGKTEIWAMNSDDGKSTFVSSVPNILLSTAFVSNGTQLVIKPASGQLGIVDLDGNGKITSILEVNYPIYYPFKIDEQTVGFMSGDLRVSDIVKMANGEDTSSVISSSFHDYIPAYAQISGTTAFVSTRSGRQQIWMQENNGDLRQLTSFKKSYRIANLSISNDGKNIAYAVNTQIHLIDASGKLIFTSNDEVIYKNPAFSEDGSNLYYSMFYYETWRVESRSLSNINTPVNHTEGYIVKPCQNGDCLYFIKYNDSTLYKFERNIVKNTGIDVGDIQNPNQIEIIGNVIYYSHRNKSGTSLMKFDMSTSVKTKILSIPSRHFAIIDDKPAIYTSRMRESESKIEKFTIPTY